ncbi:MAG: EpsI family protein [Puniceicoccales bacterium]|jgi:hypothetical protein|nr:EpsI family protein [Puniceicoccales bacterium]
MKKKKIFLITGTVILAWIAGLFVYVAAFTKVVPSITQPIAQLLPTEIPGWTSRELSLAGTETMSEIASQILRFDQYIYRQYQKGPTHVEVYVAYWGPGKITTTDAGVHNPDSCWVSAGWTRDEREHGKEISLGTKKMKPLEYGIYSKKEQQEFYRQPVIFWHLVGGEVNRYEDQKQGWRSGVLGRLDRVPLVIADLKKYGLNQRREQMFIRITANRSFDALLQDPDFIRLLEALEPLGIFEGHDW